MRTSTEIDKLMAALAKAQGEMTDPTLGGRGHHGTYSRLSDGLPAARKVLAKHGIAFLQYTEIGEGNNALIWTRLAMAGQHIEGSYPLALFNDSQKQGAASTYARRYSAWMLLGLAPGEDDDAQSTVDAKAKPRTKPKAKAQGNGHHDSFKAHQGQFFATLKELSWDYATEVAPWCEASGWGRPTAWTTAKRDGLLKALAGGEKAEALLAWVEARKATGGES